MNKSAYYVIPSQVAKFLIFENKTIDDILDYVDASDISDLEIIPISPGILIWANRAVVHARHNIAFKLDVDDSLVFGKAIFTGLMQENGFVSGLSGDQFSSIPNLVHFPSFGY
jgi:hypothetical protein